LSVEVEKMKLWDKNYEGYVEHKIKNKELLDKTRIYCFKQNRVQKYHAKQVTSQLCCHPFIPPTKIECSFTMRNDIWTTIF